MPDGKPSPTYVSTPALTSNRSSSRHTLRSMYSNSLMVSNLPHDLDSPESRVMIDKRDHVRNAIAGVAKTSAVFGRGNASVANTSAAKPSTLNVSNPSSMLGNAAPRLVAADKVNVMMDRMFENARKAGGVNEPGQRSRHTSVQSQPGPVRRDTGGSYGRQQMYAPNRSRY